MRWLFFTAKFIYKPVCYIFDDVQEMINTSLIIASAAFIYSRKRKIKSRMIVPLLNVHLNLVSIRLTVHRFSLYPYHVFKTTFLTIFLSFAKNYDRKFNPTRNITLRNRVYCSRQTINQQ